MVRIHIKLLITFIYLVTSASCFGQSLSESVADSIRKLSCLMTDNDQLFRDSLTAAQKSKDTTTIDKYVSLLQWIDSFNFKTLEGIMVHYGCPNPKLFGKGTCTPTTVLIHWSKQFPEWFNKPELVPFFRKEIIKGNLPLWAMDFAHFAYITYMEPDLQYFELINKARTEYGLPLYTRKQYLKEEVIYPMD